MRQPRLEAPVCPVTLMWCRVSPSAVMFLHEPGMSFSGSRKGLLMVVQMRPILLSFWPQDAQPYSLFPFSGPQKMSSGVSC